MVGRVFQIVLIMPESCSSRTKRQGRSAWQEWKVVWDGLGSAGESIFMKHTRF